MKGRRGARGTGNKNSRASGRAHAGPNADGELRPPGAADIARLFPVSRSFNLTLAVALVSAGALAYQLLLMRWLAIAHWHPFAVMIISLALLGHGASGTWLGLWLDAARRRFDVLFPLAALLFALTAVAVLPLAGAVPFNGLELVWNPRQLLWLALLYLLLSLPFFFAASCFGLAFARFGEAIPRLYGADMVGAGAGALLATLVLLLLPVEQGLAAAAGCGVLAAALTAPRRRGVAWVLAATVLLLAVMAATRALQPPVNEYKGLAKTLLLRDARIIAQAHGPYGWLAVAESPRVPLRHAPGLSLANTQEPPPQLGLFTDGDGFSAVTHHRGDPRAVGYLQRMTSALPYRVHARPRVLVLGAGGGQDALQVLAAGARGVDVVDVDARRLRLLRETFDDYAGHVLTDPRVRSVIAEPRAFARSTGARYDLVVLGESGSFAGGSAGVQAASEQYALTVEALRDYRRLLAPGGLVAVTRYAKQPPRDELKLFATAVQALRAEGVVDPGGHLAVIRNWDASTLLLARDPLPPTVIARVRAFADAQGFDLVHLPGLRADEANRHNLLARDYLAEGARALLSPRADAYLRDYKFAIAPATDARPYFGDFFRWRSLPELWRLRDQGGAVLLDSGYLLLLAALAQAVPLAVVLVLLPLWLRARSRDTTRSNRRWRVIIYFVALGLAFLIVEIASLSRLTLLVGHPLLAATAGLAGFLAFAGGGSLLAQRLLARATLHEGDVDVALARHVRRAVLAIALGLLWQSVCFALAFDRGTAWPVAARALVGLVGIAPLAFAMGLPFPLGLARLARSEPAFVPWAWGLNGVASVVAAIAALLLAMAVGLHATLLCALGLYALAAWIWPAASRTQ